MKLTIEATERIVQLNGVPARIWKGTTESGVEVHCFVARIAVPEEAGSDAHAEFERELRSCPEPLYFYPGLLL